ncbi:hypothetical protein JCM8547_007567 [Rhodosporidiobolus lusitaniae]
MSPMGTFVMEQTFSWSDGEYIRGARIVWPKTSVYVPAWLTSGIWEVGWMNLNGNSNSLVLRWSGVEGHMETSGGRLRFSNPESGEELWSTAVSKGRFPKKPKARK